MLRDREVEDATAFVCQDEEDIENLKPNRRNRKEVHGNYVFHVILQKSSPTLRRRSSVSDQIFAYSGFADLDTEFQQLAVYLRRSPEWVLATHPADELP
jgi:hypothetical protein